jgi:hypothetical protein
MTVVASPLVVSRDANRWVMDGVHGQSPYIANMLFSGAAVKTSTPPAGAKFVKIATTVVVYFSVHGTAAVPTGDVTDGTGSELITIAAPVMVALDGSTAVSVAAGAACTVSIVYYS